VRVDSAAAFTEATSNSGDSAADCPKTPANVSAAKLAPEIVRNNLPVSLNEDEPEQGFVQRLVADASSSLKTPWATAAAHSSWRIL